VVRYVPILKWKQAEYGALSKLDPTDKDHVLPIIEMLPPDGNFTPQDLALEATNRFESVATKFGLQALKHGFGIDGRYLFSGGTSIKRLVRICAHQHRQGLQAWPVVDPDRVLAEVPDLPLMKPFGSAFLRAPVRTSSLSESLQALADLRQVLGKRAQITAVLDMEGFGDADDTAFIKLVDPMIKAFVADGRANRVVLAGGSFPASLSSFKQGRSDIKRREWGIWTHFHKISDLTPVVFGDYSVTNPKLVVIPKGTPIPVLAQLRYAMTDKWVLHRGAVVKGKAGFQQYKQLCTLMIASPEYRGEKFSFGDKMIKHHHDPATTTGSPPTWRRDATSHHLVYTLRQLTLPGGVVPAVP